MAIRVDITVATVYALADIYVSEYHNGANAWVVAENTYFTLVKTSGATPDANTIQPTPGSPRAGGDNARWLRNVPPTAAGMALSGLFSDRPAPSAALLGVTYNATDLDELFICIQTGASTYAWDMIYGDVVFVRPLGGGLDDAAPIVALINANAYKRAVYFLPGTYNWKTAPVINSGARWLENPGATILCALNSAVTSECPIFSERVTYGTVYALSSDVAIGATSIVTTTSIPAGTRIVLARGGVSNGQTGSQYLTGTPSGGGPFTIPIDRPTQYSYSAATPDIVKAIASQAKDIVIDGNGMLITGVCYGYISFSGAALRCSVKNIRCDTSGGSPGTMGISALYDSYALQCTFDSISIDAPNLQGFFWAACDECSAYDLYVRNHGAANNGAGYFFQSTANSTVIDCRADECNVGIRFGSADGVSGPVNCSAVGGSFNGSTLYGVHVGIGSVSAAIVDVRGYANGQAGIFIDPSTVAPKDTRITHCDFQWNTFYGINNGAGCKGTVAVNVDVSNNASVGFLSADDIYVSGLIARGNTNGAAGHSAFRSTAGEVKLVGFLIQSSLANWVAVNGQGGRMICSEGQITVNDVATTSKAMQISGANTTLYVSDIVVDGSNTSSSGFAVGISSSVASNTVRIGSNVDLTKTRTQLSLAGPTNRGTVVANPVGTGVDVTWPDLKATDRVTLTRSVDGGTVGPTPRISYTPGTKFTITGTAADSSTYEYIVQ